MGIFIFSNMNMFFHIFHIHMFIFINITILQILVYNLIFHVVINLQRCFLYQYLYNYFTLLQYCCLENPMDGGAWQAAVHGVMKSRTRLSDFTFTFLHQRRKWQPIPVFLPGESQGQRSLAGYSRKEQDTLRDSYFDFLCFPHMQAVLSSCCALVYFLFLQDYKQFENRD